MGEPEPKRDATLTPDQWQLIDDLFAQVSEQPDPDRAIALLADCPDPVVRAEVQSLLGHITAGDKLSGVVAAVAGQLGAAQQLGRRIGPYKLTGQLGEGGMGVVYAAERDDAEFQRTVAIKILQHGFGSQAAIARFRDERQILATLEHPGIVRLLDGGTTEDGSPYLVMERVDGVPITKYAAGLPIRDRIELVRAVCAALQYAHGRLVVHRDIKPSNILVTVDGQPTLLDFGIAKLIDPDAAREAQTGTGVGLLTPAYASPEQARGELVTVATDVYSVGAVLYELLTGKVAVRVDSGPVEILRAICDVEPQRPSVAAPEMRRELAGDLDNIVLKALAKDPRRRYASIQHLADDLQRHLDGAPVLAREATLSYRTRKFVRRHRGKLALAILATAGLSTMTAISVVQARRADAAAEHARQRYQEVRSLANSLLFEIDEAIRDVAGTTRARELVVSRALTYLDGLAVEADEPAIIRELAMGYMKIGDIQGNPYDPNLGRPNDGLASYDKGLALLSRLDPSDPSVAVVRVRATYNMGFLHHGNRDIPRARAKLALAERLARELPAGVELDHTTQVRGPLTLAQIARDEGDVVGLDEQMETTLAIVSRWDPKAEETRYWRELTLMMRGDSAMRAGDPEKALVSIREAMSINDALTSEQPTIAKYQRERAYAQLFASISMSGVGDSRLWVANTGELGQAEALAQSAIEIFQRLATDDPLDANIRISLGITRASLALVIAKRSPADSLPELDRALEVFEQVPPTIRSSGYGRENEFIIHCAKAHALAVLGRPTDARSAADRGTALAAGNDLNVAICESLLVQMDRALGDDRAAGARLETLAHSLRPLSSQSDAAAVIGLVDTLEQLAVLRPVDACGLHTEALGHWRKRGEHGAYWRRRRSELDAAVSRCPGR